MTRRRDMAWLMVNGARELCWCFAWACFCTATTLGTPYPFLAALVAFGLAVFLTEVSLGRGWRIVLVILVELAGLIAGALLVLHGLYYSAEPLWTRRWVLALWEGPQGVTGWLHFLLQLLLIQVLWWNGAALARRPRGYISACRRFDLGLTAFLVLFLIKLVALVKGFPGLEEPLSLLFLYPFLLFALAAIGREQLAGPALRTFLPGYRAIGVIASFVGLALLAAGSVFLLFQPVLKAAAQLGLRALAAAAAPLAPVIITILRAIFGPRNVAQPPPPAAVPPELPWAMANHTPTWWTALLERIVTWGLGGLMFLGMVAALAVLLYAALRWLLSRTARDAGPGPSSPRPWWQVLRAALTALQQALRHLLRGYPTAASLYGSLQGWALRSGLTPAPAETPARFGQRLRSAFPRLQRPLTGIIAAYEREVYGEERLDAATLIAVNAAWRRLKSPRFWPARFKTWLAPAARAWARSGSPLPDVLVASTDGGGRSAHDGLGTGR